MRSSIRRPQREPSVHGRESAEQHSRRAQHPTDARHVWYAHRRGFSHDHWSLDRMGSASSLYSDATIDNVFGLVPLWIPGDGLKGVYFYPHADGSPNHSYGLFSDFRVMEDLVCGRLQTVGGIECGTIDVKN